ncbi:hypothetical protein ACMYYO_05885 [Dermacoccaceae bacterium W4C1]
MTDHTPHDAATAFTGLPTNSVEMAYLPRETTDPVAQGKETTAYVDDRDKEKERWRGIRAHKPTSHLGQDDGGDRGAVV